MTVWACQSQTETTYHDTEQAALTHATTVAGTQRGEIAVYPMEMSA